MLPAKVEIGLHRRYHPRRGGIASGACRHHFYIGNHSLNMRETFILRYFESIHAFVPRLHLSPFDNKYFL